MRIYQLWAGFRSQIVREGNVPDPHTSPGPNSKNLFSSTLVREILIRFILAELEEAYSRGMSKPNGFKLETKQVERVPAFGPSTRRTMARADESNSAPTFSTITL